MKPRSKWPSAFQRLAPALFALWLVSGIFSSCDDFARPEAIPSNRYAILVGVRDYQTINDLSNPDKDVADLEALLVERGWSVQTLINSQATYAAIEDAVAGLSTDDSATVLVYFSGHGHVMDENTYILPYDFHYSSYYDSSTYVNGITPAQLSSWLGAVPARHRLLILDSCYSGGFSQGETFADMSPRDYSARSGSTWDTPFFLAALSKLGSLVRANLEAYGDKEVQTLAAAGPEEESYEDNDPDHMNGAFTYYLLKAGEMDSGTGRMYADSDADDLVTLDEAYEYTRKWLKLDWNDDFEAFGRDFLPHISGGTENRVLYAL